MLDWLRGFLAPEQARSAIGEAPSWETQMARIQRTTQRPWRGASVREALGVPAVQRAVTMIANAGGALSMNAYRSGVKVAPDERPRIVVRPNPLTTPHVFWRDSFFWKACYGERWWWVPKRDSDGYALSLYPVPPYEVRVEDNPQNPSRPRIFWRNQEMRNEDMRLDVLIPDPNNPLRGVGPLQLCGAAVSVAVEAQEWAANFYATGGFPNVVLKSDYEFKNEEEPTLLKTRWTSNPPNTPQVLGGGLDVKEIKADADSAGMLSSRLHQNGEVALMFGIPGSLLEHGVEGSTITYQNVGGEFDKFVKSCLWPNYLEGSEQDLTDLLPRAWVAEFDTNRFTRPDPKTRYEIYKLASEAGLPWSVDMAAREEGEAPGSIETAALPPSPPLAFPTNIPTRSAMSELRCDGMTSKRRHGVSRIEVCNRLLSKEGTFVGACPRCKKVYSAAA